MRMIYSPEFTALWRTLPVVLAAGAATTPVHRAGAVSGVALLDTSGPELVLEASRDGFATLVFEQPLNGVSNGVCVPVIPAISDALWRVRAVQAASVGTVYPGVLSEFQAADWPYALETAIVANDLKTEGGVGISEILYEAVQGSLAFSLIAESEINTVWRPWHAATRGGRLGWVIEDHFTGALHLVRSPVSRFPLDRVKPGLWSGSITLEGMQ
jgi:hypothetical protein